MLTDTKIKINFWKKNICSRLTKLLCPTKLLLLINGYYNKCTIIWMDYWSLIEKQYFVSLSQNDIKTKTIGICHQTAYMICDCYKHVLSYWSNISCGPKLIRGQTYRDDNDDDIDEIDMDAINAFFVTNYRDDQIDITTKKVAILLQSTDFDRKCILNYLLCVNKRGYFYENKKKLFCVSIEKL